MAGMPDPSDDVIHLEADIHATADNPNGFARDEFVPYLKVHYEILPAGGGKPLQSGEFLPMVAADGLHYGANVLKPPPGQYRLVYKIDPPALGRHVGAGGVAPWWEPFEATLRLDDGPASARVRREVEATMSVNTTIEWTDVTWNPIRGCTKISPGCAHCYAETFAERFRGVPGHPYEQGFDLRIVREKWAEPFEWTRPRMVFVNSMSDLFHRDVDDATIVAITRVMAAADWHTYQVLTKRSERLRDMLRGPLRFAAERPHIWWGVSVEDRKHGLPRIEHLRAAPAGLRMLSVEPLLEDLGPFDLDGHRLGHRRRRERPRRAAARPGLDPRGPRPLRRGGRAVLLQAVGRRP